MAGTRFDIAIIGGGIAGASAAFFLAGRARVAVLEQEPQPGYHSSGRSAALFTETYGDASALRLTAASRAFLETPPPGFCEHPLLTPRGMLLIGADEDRAALASRIEEWRALAPAVRSLSDADALALVPVLKPAAAACAMLEPGAMDIDTHALHSGYLRGARAQGASILCNAAVERIEPLGRGWRLTTRAGVIEAALLVNAAGAWADEIARMAGLTPLGMVAKRRTALTIDVPTGIRTAAWPMVMDTRETFYFKPDAGRVLLSPADETPSPPCDAQPEELDVATAIDRYETATTLVVRRIAAKWAGLRVFAPDQALVAGFDPASEAFFWLAGQGGCGIQTSPAMARVAAGLILEGALPADILERGATAVNLSPARLRQ